MENMISDISNIITALSAIAMVVIAVIALNTWRKEFIGKRKIELAREIMTMILNIQDLLIAARQPLHTLSETEAVLEWMNREKTKNPERVNIYPDKIHFLIPNHRLNQRNDLIDKFSESFNEAYIYWGEDIFKLFQELHLCIYEVRDASNKLYYSNTTEKFQDLLKIVSGASKDNEMTKKIESIVEEIKLNLEPIYKGQQPKWKKLR
jgi:hypothetical protein